MAFRIGLIQINVTDLDVAWTFYVDKLGIPGARRLGANNPFELCLPDGPLVLVYPVTHATMRAYPDESGVVIVFYTDNLRATVTDWSRRGVSFRPIAWAKDETGIAHSPFGEFIAFEDPFGNVHELLEPKSAKSIS